MPRTIGERKSSLRVAYQVKTQVRECVIRHHGTALGFDGIEKPNHVATPNLVERGVAEAGIDQSLQRCLAISSGTEGRALTLKIFSQMAISVSRRTSRLRGSVPTSRLARAGVGLGGASGRAPAFAAPGEVVGPCFRPPTADAQGGLRMGASGRYWNTIGIPGQIAVRSGGAQQLAQRRNMGRTSLLTEGPGFESRSAHQAKSLRPGDVGNKTYLRHGSQPRAERVV
jgi:hypothetical protein